MSSNAAPKSITSSPNHRGGSLKSRSSGERPSLSRRPSTQERIDGILETARQRADTMDSGGPDQDLDMAFRRTSSPPEHDESVDETTRIVTGRNLRDYQGTSTSSAQVNRRHSRQSRIEQQNDAEPTHQNGSTPQAAEKHWWRDHLGIIWSIELENKGSVARDHLALERTFLAWLRTSLAFASIGIAITQLFRLNTSISDRQQNDHHLQTLRKMGKPLGAAFLAISILVLLLGYHRYYQGQQWVMKGKFPASRGTIILVSFVAFALMVVSLIVVVYVQHQDGS
ncbi:hypothetical protein F4778DRAFT_716352 [Xylariomycetidae sp. FL2044]|nr:hypothetical protein F4778DRAFT_716352 [Xylariomycetidae sp. FL2044]